MSVGYRPYYYADIAATFELAKRPDEPGTVPETGGRPACAERARSRRGPAHTIVGDGGWKDYEVSVDASIDNYWVGLAHG